MKIKIERKWKKSTYTIGRLYVNGVYFCNTLEDKDRGLKSTDSLSIIKSKKVYGETAIPSGTYEILVGSSSRDICASVKVDVTSSSKKAFTITPQTTMGDMLRNREMAKLITPAFEAACNFIIGDLSDEEFAKQYPFTKEAMVEMIKSNPFRCDRGKNGKTLEMILNQVDEYNRALDK